MCAVEPLISSIVDQEWRIPQSNGLIKVVLGWGFDCLGEVAGVI